MDQDRKDSDEVNEAIDAKKMFDFMFSDPHPGCIFNNENADNGDFRNGDDGFEDAGGIMGFDDEKGNDKEIKNEQCALNTDAMLGSIVVHVKVEKFSYFVDSFFF